MSNTKSKPTSWASDSFNVKGTITRTYKHVSTTEGAEDKYQTYADPKITLFGEGKSMASVSFSVLYTLLSPELESLTDTITEKLLYRRNLKGELVQNQYLYDEDMARGLMKQLIKLKLVPITLSDWEAERQETTLHEVMGSIQLDGIPDLREAINTAILEALSSFKVTLTKEIAGKNLSFRALTPIQQMLPTDKNTKKFRAPYVDFVCERPDDWKDSSLAGYAVELTLTLRLSLGFKDGKVQAYKQFNVRDMVVLQTNDELPPVLADINSELSALYVERSKEAKLQGLRDKYKDGGADVMGISLDALAAEYETPQPVESTTPRAKANVKKKATPPIEVPPSDEESDDMWEAEE